MTDLANWINENTEIQVPNAQVLYAESYVSNQQ